MSSEYRRPSQPAFGPSWIGQLGAVFIGTVLAGIVLLVGVRAYLRWSVEDTMRPHTTERAK